MLHLRAMGLLNLDVLTVTGEKLGAVLDWWESSERRHAARARLQEADGIPPDRVIMSADAARRAGLASTVVFPVGNIAPEGSVVKATAIDPSVVDEDDVYRHRGPARVFVSERDAIAAIKGRHARPVQPNDVIVLIGAGPLGTGMEETYQLTAGAQVPALGQDGRDRDGRPLLGRVDRRLHRARRAGGARRGDRSGSSSTATRSRS